MLRDTNKFKNKNEKSGDKSVSFKLFSKKKHFPHSLEEEEEKKGSIKSKKESFAHWVVYVSKALTDITMMSYMTSLVFNELFKTGDKAYEDFSSVNENLTVETF